MAKRDLIVTGFIKVFKAALFLLLTVLIIEYSLPLYAQGQVPEYTKKSERGSER